MQFLGLFESLPNHIQIRCGRFHTRFRFLLKHMEDVDHSCELDSVHRPISSTTGVFDHFENTSSSKTFQNLRFWMLLTPLGIEYGLPEGEPHRFWKFAHIVDAQKIGRFL